MVNASRTRLILSCWARAELSGGWMLATLKDIQGSHFEEFQASLRLELPRFRVCPLVQDFEEVEERPACQRTQRKVRDRLDLRYPRCSSQLNVLTGLKTVLHVARRS